MTLLITLLINITFIYTLYLGYIYTNDLTLFSDNINILENSFFTLCMVIDRLIQQYFYTFRYCWTVILFVLCEMISKYIVLLDCVAKYSLVYPTNLILGIILCVLLWIIRLILKDL